MLKFTSNPQDGGMSLAFLTIHESVITSNHGIIPHRRLFASSYMSSCFIVAIKILGELLISSTNISHRMLESKPEENKDNHNRHENPMLYKAYLICKVVQWRGTVRPFCIPNEEGSICLYGRMGPRDTCYSCVGEDHMHGIMQRKAAPVSQVTMLLLRATSK